MQNYTMTECIRQTASTRSLLPGYHLNFQPMSKAPVLKRMRGKPHPRLKKNKKHCCSRVVFVNFYTGAGKKGEQSPNVGGCLETEDGPLCGGDGIMKITDIMMVHAFT